MQELDSVHEDDRISLYIIWVCVSQIPWRIVRIITKQKENIKFAIWSDQERIIQSLTRKGNNVQLDFVSFCQDFIGNIKSSYLLSLWSKLWCAAFKMLDSNYSCSITFLIIYSQNCWLRGRISCLRHVASCCAFVSSELIGPSS